MKTKKLSIIYVESIMFYTTNAISNSNVLNCIERILRDIRVQPWRRDEISNRHEGEGMQGKRPESTSESTTMRKRWPAIGR